MINKIKSSPYYRLVKQLSWDFHRLKARLFVRMRYAILSDQIKNYDKIQFAAGPRKVPGWLNVDVVHSDLNLDLGCANFPFDDCSYSTITSQHLVEHLDMDRELKRFLSECFRILNVGGEMYLSTPDLTKICLDYVNTGGEKLLKDRMDRVESYCNKNRPASRMLNDLIFQNGQHRCIFDYKLLRYELEQAGFKEITEIREVDFNVKFPEFKPRRDDLYTLYVVARK